MTLNNLAQLLRRDGSTRMAEQMLRKALAIRSEALGANHPAVDAIVARLIGSAVTLRHDTGATTSR